MVDASPLFAIRAVSADSASWTPIVVPIQCSTWSIRPDAAVKIRTDANDPLTEDTIAQGMQITFQVPFQPDQAATRFRPGDTIAYLQAVTGTALVHVQFAK